LFTTDSIYGFKAALTDVSLFNLNYFYLEDRKVINLAECKDKLLNLVLLLPPRRIDRAF